MNNFGEKLPGSFPLNVPNVNYDNLPEHVRQKIALRLPLDDRIQLRTVSRTDYISDPDVKDELRELTQVARYLPEDRDRWPFAFKDRSNLHFIANMTSKQIDNIVLHIVHHIKAKNEQRYLVELLYDHFFGDMYEAHVFRTFIDMIFTIKGNLRSAELIGFGENLLTFFKRTNDNFETLSPNLQSMVSKEFHYLIATTKLIRTYVRLLMKTGAVTNLNDLNLIQRFERSGQFGYIAVLPEFTVLSRYVLDTEQHPELIDSKHEGNTIISTQYTQ